MFKHLVNVVLISLFRLLGKGVYFKRHGYNFVIEPHENNHFLITCFDGTKVESVILDKLIVDAPAQYDHELRKLIKEIEAEETKKKSMEEQLVKLRKEYDVEYVGDMFSWWYDWLSSFSFVYRGKRFYYNLKNDRINIDITYMGYRSNRSYNYCSDHSIPYPEGTTLTKENFPFEQIKKLLDREYFRHVDLSKDIKKGLQNL